MRVGVVASCLSNPSPFIPFMRQLAMCVNDVVWGSTKCFLRPMANLYQDYLLSGPSDYRELPTISLVTSTVQPLERAVLGSIFLQPATEIHHTYILYIFVNSNEPFLVTYNSRYPTTYFIFLTGFPQTLTETVLILNKNKTWHCYEDGSPHSSVSTVTRLRSIWMRNLGRLPAGVKRIFFLSKIQTTSVAHQAYQIGTLSPA
jgi:hypothetical protein